MKKAFVILSIMILIIAPALADTDGVMTEYNRNTILTSATKLSGTPVIRKNKNSVSYDFDITDNIIVSVSESNNEILSCSVICKDESESAEFLAQCAASASTIVGFDNTFYLYAEILDMFLQTRSGETVKQRNSYTAKAVYQMTKESFGYLFIIAR